MLKFSFGLLTIVGVLAVGFAGFRGDLRENLHVEWFNDMAHQPKKQPQHTTDFFADRRAERMPVPGTIPMGFTLEGRYLQTEGNNLGSGTGGFTNVPDYFHTGRIGDFYGNGIPEQLVNRGSALLSRGQERYNINCAICHGKDGKGAGVVKSFGLATVANITSDLFKAQPDGQIFNTITHGKLTMGAYGPVITPEDRWAIVAYVRALQKAADPALAAAAAAQPAPSK